jgi:glycogen(starch) synthase
MRESWKIDLIISPIWDAEGLHIVLDDTMNSVVTLQTTFKTFSEIERNTLDAATVEELAIMEEMVLSNARNVHAISGAINDQVTGYYKKREGSRWEVAHLGIDDVRLPNRRRSSKDEQGKIRILYVSRLERRKGTDILLRAAVTILEKHDQVEFELVGRGIEPDSWLRDMGRAHHALLSRIRFCGELPDYDVLQAYADADIFCVPSRFESFGLIYLEAIRSDLPVVACAVGGVPELVEHDVTGLLIEPDNVSALIEALDRLILDCELRVRMGQAGRRRFLEQFTAERMVERTLALYQSYIVA